MPGLEPTDPRRAFIYGAEWWATKQGQAIPDNIWAEANRYFPKGQMDKPDGLYGRRPLEGAWPKGYVGRAFVEGAKWQEYASESATMWQSDQRDAEDEAMRRFPLEISTIQAREEVR